jgi:uncharacterized protein involved in oxidation of intracellular sulfur
MRMAIVIATNEPETVWNALRLAIFARKSGDEVGVFLLGKGVECETIDTPQFSVTERLRELLEAGGDIRVCGTCLKVRQQGDIAACPTSTMADLHRMVRDADRVLTF